VPKEGKTVKLTIALVMALSIPLAAQSDSKMLIRYYVPQIADGGSWTTSFVIYNPSEKSSAGGLLSFFSDTGGPLQLEVLVGGVSQQITDHVSISLSSVVKNTSAPPLSAHAQ
jgi:hypothetical protein